MSNNDKEKSSAARVPAVASHTALALRKKGYSKQASWKIARASLTKNRYLKGPYRERDGGVPKMTKKGQNSSAKHAGEKDAPQKFKQFVRDFTGVVEARTHHAKNVKFISPDAANFVVRDGERLKVVRQLRRMKNRRLSPEAWKRDGEVLVRTVGVEVRYVKATPSEVKSSLCRGAPVFKKDEPRVHVKRESPYIVSMRPADGGNLDDALILATATGHDVFSDPWGEGGGLEGFEAVAAAREAGVAYLLRREK